MQTQKEGGNKFRAKIFYALSDPLRLDIIDFLREEEKCVCEIIPYLGIPQPVVSRHLKILKDSGLVKDRKDGTKRFYTLTDKRIVNVVDSVSPELVKDLSKHIIEQII
ncbi:MAG: metalloregulator ArsR/SmtB family transcription factor [Nitrososphaeria archaeon]